MQNTNRQCEIQRALGYISVYKELYDVTALRSRFLFTCFRLSEIFNDLNGNNDPPGNHVRLFRTNVWVQNRVWLASHTSHTQAGDVGTIVGTICQLQSTVTWGPKDSSKLDEKWFHQHTRARNRNDFYNEELQLTSGFARWRAERLKWAIDCYFERKWLFKDKGVNVVWNYM